MNQSFLLLLTAGAALVLASGTSTRAQGEIEPQAAAVQPATDPNIAPLATKVNPKDALTYVWIPPGQFKTGCSAADEGCDEDETPHEVTIAKGFWIGQTPVTQAAYKHVSGENPSFFHHSDSDQLPAERVRWIGADACCKAVGMRLPTEAEYEYAARANSPEPRYGDLDAIAWYKGNSNGRTHEVATKLPNAWHLYDMLGNVWELHE